MHSSILTVPLLAIVIFTLGVGSECSRSTHAPDKGTARTTDVQSVPEDAGLVRNNSELDYLIESRSGRLAKLYQDAEQKFIMYYDAERELVQSSCNIVSVNAQKEECFKIYCKLARETLGMPIEIFLTDAAVYHRALDWVRRRNRNARRLSYFSGPWNPVGEFGKQLHMLHLELRRLMLMWGNDEMMVLTNTAIGCLDLDGQRELQAITLDLLTSFAINRWSFSKGRTVDNTQDCIVKLERFLADISQISSRNAFEVGKWVLKLTTSLYAFSIPRDQKMAFPSTILNLVLKYIGGEPSEATRELFKGEDMYHMVVFSQYSGAAGYSGEEGDSLASLEEYMAMPLAQKVMEMGGYLGDNFQRYVIEKTNQLELWGLILTQMREIPTEPYVAEAMFSSEYLLKVAELLRVLIEECGRPGNDEQCAELTGYVNRYQGALTAYLDICNAYAGLSRVSFLQEYLACAKNDKQIWGVAQLMEQINWPHE